MVPFSFPVDWSDSVKVSREFKTDIFTSRSGKEQRRALRQTPRKAVEFSVTATGAQQGVLNATMAKSRGQTVTITDPTTGGTLQGRMAQEMSATTPTNTTTRLAVHFDVEPGSEELSVPAAPQTYNGRELFLMRPNWAQDVSLTYRQVFDALDYGQGRTLNYDYVGFLTRIFRATFVGKTADEMAAIEANFLRALGQRGEFYMPTWTNDMVLLNSASALDGSFHVGGTDLAATYGGDTVFKAVMILMTDGSQRFYEVESIVTDSGNSLVGLNGGLGVDLTPATVQMISWMPVWRHATDQLTSEWLTSEVGQIQLTLQTLEDLPPET